MRSFAAAAGAFHAMQCKLLRFPGGQARGRGLPRERGRPAQAKHCGAVRCRSEFMKRCELHGSMNPKEVWVSFSDSEGFAGAMQSREPMQRPAG